MDTFKSRTRCRFITTNKKNSVFSFSALRFEKPPNIQQLFKGQSPCKSRIRLPRPDFPRGLYGVQRVPLLCFRSHGKVAHAFSHANIALRLVGSVFKVRGFSSAPGAPNPAQAFFTVPPSQLFGFQRFTEQAAPVCTVKG